ncbi:pseudouridine synthase pus4 [Coemansia sp. RSA 1646]|nr:pseudouridine synthase pus4 [Coemansia sp. RSA 1646]KAJ2091119.1 pseudouridine synthase pus4 [Coemansia sp. RSA 986]
MSFMQVTRDTLRVQASAKLAAAAVTTGGLFAVNKPPGISCTGFIDYIKRNAGLGERAISFSDHFEMEKQLRKPGKKIYRKKYHTNLRIGHAGTLDVEAAGVLVLGVESGCKLLGDYLKGEKSYMATGRLGLATDSYDAEGKITHVGDASGVTSDMILRTIPRFIGDIEQTPPLYSAIRIDGKRLYEYMRSGEPIPVKVKPRKVHISDIKLLHYKPQQQKEQGSTGVLEQAVYGKRVVLPPECVEYFTGGRFAWDEKSSENKVPCVGDYMYSFLNQPNAPTIQLLVRSGGGVYIRSLIHNMGEALGCGASMAMLVRTSQGPLRLGRDTIDVQDLPYIAKITEAMRRTQACLDESTS